MCCKFILWFITKCTTTVFFTLLDNALTYSFSSKIMCPDCTVFYNHQYSRAMIAAWPIFYYFFHHNFCTLLGDSNFLQYTKPTHTWEYCISIFNPKILSRLLYCLAKASFLFYLSTSLYYNVHFTLSWASVCLSGLQPLFIYIFFAFPS